MKIQSIKLLDGYILRELGGEFCIFNEKDSDNGSLLGLPSINETCIFLWDKMGKGISTIEMVKSVAEKFDLDYEDAEYEVGEFIAKLIHGNVIEFE